eukprot:Amastigsp_a509349_4.p4 type:complete len:109 gc:universal Amastigsp_a509349_4:203-529(+)
MMMTAAAAQSTASSCECRRSRYGCSIATDIPAAIKASTMALAAADASRNEVTASTTASFRTMIAASKAKNGSENRPTRNPKRRLSAISPPAARTRHSTPTKSAGIPSA